MAGIRLYLDEDIPDSLARALRARGLDALSTNEAGMAGSSDERQLAYAAASGRAILTFNVTDFLTLHSRWAAEGRSHSGIIVSTQEQFGVLLRRTLRLLDSEQAERVSDLLLWLNPYEQPHG